MQKLELEVYSPATNSAVVRMTGRRFPGVLLQGDSLSILLSGLMTALEGAEGKVDEETFLTLLEQAQTLEEHLLHYEATLQEHGIDLPYVPDQRSTMRYARYWEQK